MTSAVEDLGEAGDYVLGARNDDIVADLEDLTPEEQAALDDAQEAINRVDPEMVHQIVLRTLLFVEELIGHRLHPYQRELAYRIIESVVVGDAATITALFSRQSGKTETVAATVAGMMALFPKLATIIPMLSKYKDGFWVGCFAPVEGQAETLFGRIVGFLTSERAMDILLDPEIDARPKAQTRLLTLKGLGSICRMQTANPKAKIEGRSYHLIVIDESQHADARVVRKSIRPMGAYYGATTVMLGTPDVVRGVFYSAIQRNKRVGTKRGAKQNHFQHDWRSCAKYNPDYERYVRSEMAEIGADSEEFRLSYALEWLLDRGMFTTQQQLDELGDRSMQVVHTYTATPVVAGIDLARRVDSTVVTVVWVDWDHPLEDGYYEHRILNWMELHGEDWEEQYFQVVDFLRNYRLYALGIDGQGMGDVFADRMRRLMPDVEIVAFPSTLPEQSKRWKHLLTLMQRGLLFYPAHAKTRRTRIWRRFVQQMVDLEKRQQGPHFIAEAPKEAEAHDDYPDSLALAVALTKDTIAGEVEVTDNPFYSRSR